MGHPRLEGGKYEGRTFEDGSWRPTTSMDLAPISGQRVNAATRATPTMATSPAHEVTAKPIPALIARKRWLGPGSWGQSGDHATPTQGFSN